MDSSARALARFIFDFENPDWFDQAQCRIEQIPTDEFFPMRGQSQRIARDCCSRCSVTEECWDYAERTHSAYGIWGGKIRKRGPSQDYGMMEPDDYWSFWDPIEDLI